MMRLEFKQLQAMALDFVDEADGFLFFRMAGPETVCNAILAYLSRHDKKKNKYGSKVLIWPPWSPREPERVMTAKGFSYRTLRTRLPGGMVDLAMIHPQLTVMEDTERFWLLTYETGAPANFFGRLNKALPIPLKQDWPAWLWELGQQPHSWQTLEERRVYEDGQPVTKQELVEVTRTPITRLESLGQAKCYRVDCGGLYEECWLQIIRAKLGLGRVLQSEGNNLYLGTGFVVSGTGEEWSLRRNEEVLLRAPSLDFLLARARRTLGEHFVLDQTS
jgi:hypothetical protein